MFFILNNEKAVLAADKAFLESVGAPSIFLLAELFRSGELILDEENNTYQVGGVTRSFTRTTLQTIFGKGYHYQIKEETVEPGLAVPSIQETSEEGSSLQEEKPLNAFEAEAVLPDTDQSDDDSALDPVTLEDSALATNMPEVASSSEKTTEEDLSDEIPDLSSLLTESVSDLENTPDNENFVSDEISAALQDEEALTSPEDDENDQTESLHTSETSEDDEIDLDKELLNLLEPESNDEIPESDKSEETATDTSSPSDTPEDNALLDLLELDDHPDPEASSQQTDASDPQTHASQESTSDTEKLLDLLDLEDEPQETTSTTSSDPHQKLAAAGTAVAAAVGAINSTGSETESPSSPSDESMISHDDDDDIFELLDDHTDSSDTSAPEVPSANLSDTHPAAEHASSESPFADYRHNADIIGISYEEYIGFLRQFVEESLGYETGLKSQDLYIFKKNLISIKDASQLLHLPELSETLNRLEEATSQERSELISTFFTMIRHIERDLEQEPSPDEQTSSPVGNLSPEKKTSSESPPPSAASSTFSVPDDIEAISFEFSTKAASDELGLPESLVQEFVSDFVKQAEENIPVFQEAQQKGDIDTIQKTAHLLKGAASNLRIDPLAETLKSLQYNDDLEHIPALLAQFIGQLKSLANFTQQNNG